MHSSLKSVSQIQAATPPLSEWLTTVADYLAHTKPGKTSEPFSEHVYLVDSYFEKLCEAHGLDAIIDKLVWSIVEREFVASTKKERIAEYLKELFVYVIHFHDFGKINQSFQAHPKKMNNDKFKQKYDSLIGTSHSSLGAYLYIVKYLQQSSTLGFTRTELEKVHLIILLFSYPIFKHHSPYLSTPIDSGVHFGEEVKEMSEYISCYQFDIHSNLREIIPLNLKKRYFDSINKNLQIDFSLYALLKLSFSLLTASDYLATHEYMSGDKTVDFGTLVNRIRVEEIVQNLRQSEHNKLPFELAETDYEFQEEWLRDKSNHNLNALRREMAIELIQTIRLYPNKSLYYIEAPTGGGKTNLSMIALTELLASNPELRKIFYVFPFTTLITQTYKSVRTTLDLKENELAELHSKAGIHTKESCAEENADGFYGPDKKEYIDNLFALYPITLLSHVRFFDVLKTNSKEANYLLHRLANSVVIVDELQSYNPKIWDKMLYFISQYAEYFNIRFILMSATLPKLDKLNLQLNPIPAFQELLPNAQKYLENPNFAKRVQFNFDLYDRQFDAKSEEDWIDLADIVINKSKQFAERNKEHHTVHTIIEFIYKKSASAFKQIIEKQNHPFDEVFVLSGTILEFRRRQIINQLKNTQYRKKNILLITTQVVEAGVDIDMDLGFKNISLLDSDEQLAGRVNRNANKGLCEVYLFRLDDASVLYDRDYRYKAIKNGELSQEEAREILTEKRFDKLYQQVFKRIDKFNTNALFADNFSGEILENLQRLDFSKIDQNFRIINQQNESVFVPLSIPIELDRPEEDRNFSKDDLRFLEHYEVYRKGDAQICGKAVWKLYERLIWQDIENRRSGKGYDLDLKINFKTLQSILAKYTFSLMTNSKDIQSIKNGLGEEKYGFIYFSYWNEERTNGKPYDEKGGLNAEAFSDVDFI